jgi:hypothetical protein
MHAVVRTRRDGAQSGYDYDSSNEKKSRSAHGSLPYRVATCTKRNGTVAYSVSSKTFAGLSRWSRCEIGFRYDREAGVAHRQVRAVCATEIRTLAFSAAICLKFHGTQNSRKTRLQIASRRGGRPTAGLANPAGRL